MTYAWYGHMKKADSMPIFKLILVSWGIAFFEYLFMVPANNRFGIQEGFSAFQLKTVQEVISLLVFTVFAVYFLVNQLSGTTSQHFSASSRRYALCFILLVRIQFHGA